MLLLQVLELEVMDEVTTTPATITTPEVVDSEEAQQPEQLLPTDHFPFASTITPLRRPTHERNASMSLHQ